MTDEERAMGLEHCDREGGSFRYADNRSVLAVGMDYVGMRKLGQMGALGCVHVGRVARRRRECEPGLWLAITESVKTAWELPSSPIGKPLITLHVLWDSGCTEGVL